LVPYSRESLCSIAKVGGTKRALNNRNTSEELLGELSDETTRYTSYKKKKWRPPSKKKKKPNPEEQEGKPQHRHGPPEKRRGDRYPE
jgi:hypothetical protein